MKKSQCSYWWNILKSYSKFESRNTGILSISTRRNNSSQRKKVHENVFCLRNIYDLALIKVQNLIWWYNKCDKHCSFCVSFYWYASFSLSKDIMLAIKTTYVLDWCQLTVELLNIWRRRTEFFLPTKGGILNNDATFNCWTVW